MSTSVQTYYASPERANPEKIQEQVAIFRAALLAEMLDVVSEIVLVLNQCRQIIHVNKNLLELLSISNRESVFGNRPGELLRCEQACSGPNGCGTAEGCRQCGALRAILTCTEGQRVEEECRITRQVDGKLAACDLKVCATALHRGGEPFIILALTDISHHKRRSALERIFFHDLLNMAGGLRSVAELLVDVAPSGAREEMEMVHHYATALVEEILAQRMLVSAENNELGIECAMLDPMALLQSVVNLYRRHEACNGRQLVIRPCTASMMMETDKVLLGRVLGNLVKNALEASPRGGVVTVSCALGDGSVAFEVHNYGVIPPDLQLQMLNRSFSTKGAGRGLGIYGVRLLTQNYLGGQLEVESTEQHGTTFRIRLPQQRRLP